MPVRTGPWLSAGARRQGHGRLLQQEEAEAAPRCSYLLARASASARASNASNEADSASRIAEAA